MTLPALLKSLIFAVLLATASVAAQDISAARSVKMTHRCTEFQMVRHGCVDCPGGGFARLPLNTDCYDAFEVLSAHSGRVFRRATNPAAMPYRIPTENPTVLKAIDGIREDNFGPDENSNTTIGSPIQFIFGSPKTSRFVEKIVVWKRTGNCDVSPKDLEFVPITERQLEYGSHFLDICWSVDKGEYFVVACTEMAMLGIQMKALSRSLTACDVPAELEVYGSRDARLKNEKRPA